MPTSTKTNHLTIKSLHFQGFKSIEDLNVDLVKGLNIVIGKNGSGKSNFLECIYQNWRSIYIAMTQPCRQAEMHLVSDDHHRFTLEFKRIIQKSNPNDDEAISRIKFNKKLIVDGNLVYDSANRVNKREIVFDDKKISIEGNVRNILRLSGYRVLSPLYIKFTMPINLDFFDIPGVVKIPLSSDDIWEVPSSFRFINALFINMEIGTLKSPIIRESVTLKFLLRNLKIGENLLGNLQLYTPIQNLRFNENISIYNNDDKQIVIDNLKLEFKINNSWLPWSQLSDGTRRLFYIIAEISSKKDGIVLIEEPELGVHPHQFNLLMTFLKEQAETKQIIITTHSPKALDILNESELENILLVSYTKKLGTQIDHLSTAQKKKASRYMKEVGFLSDYWLMSNLEND